MEFDADDIAARVGEPGREIAAGYPTGDRPVSGLLKGSFIFMSDLVRNIRRPWRVDPLVAASNGTGTRSSGDGRLLYDPSTVLAGTHPRLVKDIMDSGNTLNRQVGLRCGRGPRSLGICALLHKRLATMLELEESEEIDG